MALHEDIAKMVFVLLLFLTVKHGNNLNFL